MTAIEKFTMGLPPVQFAESIADTDFVPQAFRRKPHAILACLAYGSELGIGPMQALSTINVIQGKPSLSPEGMRALVLSAGHRIWPESTTNTAVTMCGQRKGDEAVVRVTWTMDDAKKAGLAGGANWSKYPRAMLLARATSELCRTLFPDVIAGISYVPEEIESFSEPHAEVETRFTSQTGTHTEPTVEGVDPETGEIVDAEIVEDKPAPKKRVRKPPTKTEPEPTKEEQLTQVEKAREVIYTDKQQEVRAALDMIGNVSIRKAIGEDWREMFSGKATVELNDEECDIALSLIRTHVETEAKPKPERVRSAPVQKIKDYLEDERPFTDDDQPTLDGPDAA